MLPFALLLTIALAGFISGLGHLYGPSWWRWPYVPAGSSHREVGLRMCGISLFLLVVACVVQVS